MPCDCSGFDVPESTFNAFRDKTNVEISNLAFMLCQACKLIEKEDFNKIKSYDGEFYLKDWYLDHLRRDYQLNHNRLSDNPDDTEEAKIAQEEAHRLGYQLVLEGKYQLCKVEKIVGKK